jgi:UPF0716 protein FxsA
MPLLALLLALPIIEIALFILVGGWIGLWPTLGLVIAAVFVGVALLRSVGANASARVRASMLQEADPSEQIVGAAMTFLAGMLLILPGFLTDAVALLLLIPQVQRAAFTALRRRARASGMVMGATMTGQPPRPRGPADRVIDAEYEDVTRPPGTTPGNAPGRPSGWTRD